MKRFYVFVLSLIILSTLAACGCNNSNVTDPTTVPTTERRTVMPTIDPTGNTSIRDPSVDTSMPDFKDDTTEVPFTGDTEFSEIPDSTGNN